MQLLYIVQCTMYQLSNCMGLEFMHNAYKVSECFHCTPVLWVAASVVSCHASITCDFFFAQAIPVGLVTNRTG